MASYVWTVAQTEISATGTEYTTVTDLTVPSGHIYFIKAVELSGSIAITSTLPTGALSFDISSSTPDRYVKASKVIPVQTAGSSAVVYVNYQFALRVGDIVTAMPAVIPNTAVIFAPSVGQESSLYNRQLGPGQVLRFSPLDSGGSGINSTGLSDIELSVRISYLDYTI